MRRAVLLLLSGLWFGSALTAPASAEPPSLISASARKPVGDLVAEAAQRFALPAAWIRAVMKTESGGDPRAVSPKGAMGLMQIMPETWRDLRIQHRLGGDPFDPRDNIIAGSAYIRWLFDRYGSPGWIAAYNAGPGRYEASLSGRPLPAETRAYVAAVVPNLSGDSDPGGVIVASINPLAWTRAPLFVAQSDRQTAADPVPEKPTSNAASAAASSPPLVRDVSAIAPRSYGLFVPRADAETIR